MCGCKEKIYYQQQNYDCNECGKKKKKKKCCPKPKLKCYSKGFVTSSSFGQTAFFASSTTSTTSQMYSTGFNGGGFGFFNANNF